jgi:hypothetical protein
MRDLDYFWPYFLSAHLHPWNRRFHLIGNAVMLSAWVAFAVTLNWRFLAVSLLGYLPSWLGHLLFEGKEPPTLRKPWVSGLANYKMVGMMLAGALPAELRRLFGSENPPPLSPVLVSEAEERAYQEKLRYRISTRIDPHPFTRYWDIFLLKHQNPVNRYVHVLAMIYLYGIIGVALITQTWQLLFAIPISPLSGLVAHKFFEPTHIDFEDALFSPRAFVCLNRMLVLSLTGGYARELERVRGELTAFRQKR